MTQLISSTAGNAWDGGVSKSKSFSNAYVMFLKANNMA